MTLYLEQLEGLARSNDVRLYCECTFNNKWQSKYLLGLSHRDNNKVYAKGTCKLVLLSV